MQMGAKGLKLHPNFQQIRLDNPENFELYEEYTGYQLPLIVHSGLTGREGNFRSARKLSSLEFIEAVPKNFPELPVVLAHAGISQYEQGITLVQKYKNVYLEISGQPVQHIRQALSAIGADRLLFGTDWPFWNQAPALQAVRQATKHDHRARQHILYENAERLLRITR
jgi:predicted TIM-barrel fold metal-dependent hydrolase